MTWTVIYSENWENVVNVYYSDGEYVPEPIPKWSMSTNDEIVAQSKIEELFGDCNLCGITGCERLATHVHRGGTMAITVIVCHDHANKDDELLYDKNYIHKEIIE